MRRVPCEDSLGIPLLAVLNVATAPRDTRRWRRAVSMAGASVVVMVLVAAALVATRPRAPSGRDREG